MPVFKIKVDPAGNFYTKAAFKLTQMGLGGPDNNKKLSLKLLKPKDANIKVLTLTLNKKTMNVGLATGKPVKTGPFALSVGDNAISFEGRSDKPDELHELEVIPQLLK